MNTTNKILWAVSALIILIPCIQAIDKIIEGKTFLIQALIQTGAMAIWCIFLFLNPNNN